MIIELNMKEYSNIKSLLKNLDLEYHPVINGVLDGNNLGRIFVDDIVAPSVAFVWAKMEMFYFIGNSNNDQFNRSLEMFILQNIKPEALELGDTDFNLEVYPFSNWEMTIKNNFRVSFYEGYRVPFEFEQNLFLNYFQKPYEIYSGYEIYRIDSKIISLDEGKIIQNEILKFWESVEKFLQTGLGYCVLKDNIVIGACISAFVSNREYEIGINTYGTEHRGKGLATSMAREFIRECMENDLIPHWTTENFRQDSIAIAKKMGFKQLKEYPVYYIPFNEWNVM